MSRAQFGWQPLTASGSRLATIILSAAVLVVSGGRAPSYTASLAPAGDWRPEESSGAGGNIHELIPPKYLHRYSRWKHEYLSTVAGREQWAAYARNQDFILTIVVAREKGCGAEVTGYRWNRSGKLVAATIILGASLDKGYPEPVSYPVTSALRLSESFSGSSSYASGDILAATKLAHEFGHVNQTARSEMRVFLLQQELIPVYNRIFLAKRRDVKDPDLLALAKKMGGTPLEIGQDREYWAEANALRYVRERVADQDQYRLIYREVERAIAEYGQGHIERLRGEPDSHP